MLLHQQTCSSQSHLNIVPFHSKKDAALVPSRRFLSPQDTLSQNGWLLMKDRENAAMDSRTDMKAQLTKVTVQHVLGRQKS